MFILVLDRCRPNPCENNGICAETSRGVQCECTPGFKGRLCERELHFYDLKYLRIFSRPRTFTAFSGFGTSAGWLSFLFD